MTNTIEQQARELAQYLECAVFAPSNRGRDRGEASRLIAAALTAARNQALEDAARSMDGQRLLEANAKAIRAIKEVSHD